MRPLTVASGAPKDLGLAFLPGPKKAERRQRRWRRYAYRLSKCISVLVFQVDEAKSKVGNAHHAIDHKQV